MVVANHPYGVLDGAILTVLLTRVRPDVKVLTNSLLGDVPELQQHCIFVDPFHTDRSVESNRRAIREALAWLQQGGMLAMFPAGRSVALANARGTDCRSGVERNGGATAPKEGATALPVYFCGHNSVGFQLMGMIHPKLRTAFLLQEFLEQKGKTVEVRVGSGDPAGRYLGNPRRSRSHRISTMAHLFAGPPKQTAKHPGPPHCDRDLPSRSRNLWLLRCRPTCCRKK